MTAANAANEVHLVRQDGARRKRLGRAIGEVSELPGGDCFSTDWSAAYGAPASDTESADQLVELDGLGQCSVRGSDRHCGLDLGPADYLAGVRLSGVSDGFVCDGFWQGIWGVAQQWRAAEFFLDAGLRVRFCDDVIFADPR